MIAKGCRRDLNWAKAGGSPFPRKSHSNPLEAILKTGTPRCKGFLGDCHESVSRGSLPRDGEMK